MTPEWPESFPNPSLVPRLQQLVWGKATTQCLFVAAKLGIADLLANGPRTVDELAAETETSAAALYRVLRLLASLEVFVELEPRQFALTPMAELLQAEAPCSFRDYAIVHGSEWYNRAWGASPLQCRKERAGIRSGLWAFALRLHGAKPGCGNRFQ